MVEKNIYLPILYRGSLVIDPQCCSVTLHKEEVQMCKSLFRVLYLLAEHPGWVFTKEQIYEEIYGEESVIDIDNTIYCLIRDLRKKFEFSPIYAKCIQTVRGVGYKFVIPEE